MVTLLPWKTWSVDPSRNASRLKAWVKQYEQNLIFSGFMCTLSTLMHMQAWTLLSHFADKNIQAKTLAHKLTFTQTHTPWNIQALYYVLSWDDIEGTEVENLSEFGIGGPKWGWVSRELCCCVRADSQPCCRREWFGLRKPVIVRTTHKHRGQPSTNTCTYTHAHTPNYKHTRWHTYAHTNTHTSMHTHTHTHTFMHTS